jgi:hypothetical protein
MTISRMTIAGVAAWSLAALAAYPALAQEKLVTTDAAVRTILAFKVSDATLHTLLPTGWQSSPFTAGASKEANVTVTFVHPIVAQGPDGQPQDLIEIAAVSLMAKRTGTEATVPLVFAGFASKPSYVPGPYGAFEIGKANVEQNVHTDPTGTSSVHESWEFTGDNAKSIQLELQYVRGPAVRGRTEARPHSAKAPEFYRIYRIEQASDVVRSAATGTDRVQKIAFKVTGQPFAQLFDGTEQLISVTSLPFFARQVSLPSSGTQ